MNVDNRYKKLLDEMTQPQSYNYSGDKEVYYLTFGMDQIQYVKKQLRTGWLDIARHKGFEPLVLSIHELLRDFFSQDEYRIEAGEDAVHSKEEMKEVYDSLGENLRNQEIIQKAILEKQEEVKSLKNSILIITDIEAMHPFTRFGPIEQKIYTKIEIPIIVLYPGKKSGSTLKFLEFYPEDGNYRSEHF